MSRLAKKRKHPEKRKKTTTSTILNIKMSTKGAQFLHLSCQGGRIAPLLPVSYATGSHPSSDSIKHTAQYVPHAGFFKGLTLLTAKAF